MPESISSAVWAAWSAWPGVGRQAWLGSPLALANLYAFGRLAWDPNLTPEQIADEWMRQTISNNPAVVRTVAKMLMQSWPAYESYTGPLGLQTLTDITGSHYGPNIEVERKQRLGPVAPRRPRRRRHGSHRRDRHGLRRPIPARGREDLRERRPPRLTICSSSSTTCPTPTNCTTAKTVIQYLYDSHYQGAAQAAQFVGDWASLKGRIDPALYATCSPRLIYQAGHAIVWRDAIVQYFLKLSGIPDETGRAGHYPRRLEAEDARLTGYKIIEVNPWEDASGGKAVSCDQAACSAEWTYNGTAGRFNIAVAILRSARRRCEILAHRQRSAPAPDASWSADATLPTPHPHGDNSTRHILYGVALKPGDTIRIEGTPDGHDGAAVDYIETLPATPAP